MDALENVFSKLSTVHGNSQKMNCAHAPLWKKEDFAHIHKIKEN
jgi:hypothetical protein